MSSKLTTGESQPETGGGVYVLHEHGTQRRKIGVSFEPIQRMSTLQSQLGRELLLVAAFPMGRATSFAVETHAHWLLRDQRVDGEWFICSDAQAIAAVGQAMEAVQDGSIPFGTRKLSRFLGLSMSEGLTDQDCAAPDEYTPGRGTRESAAWFRAKLDELRIGQTALARLMLAHGDDRQMTTILRSLGRMANGNARVSGEMRALLGVLAEHAKPPAVAQTSGFAVADQVQSERTAA